MAVLASAATLSAEASSDRLQPHPLLRQRREQRGGFERRRVDESQSNSEAGSGPQTSESWLSNKVIRYRQISCSADHVQVRRDEPHAGRCSLRGRRRSSPIIIIPHVAKVSHGLWYLFAVAIIIIPFP